MTSIDYLVIAGYIVFMLGVGAYYAYRTRTADDYLLGGRTMSPFMVGISLFATLASTLTYLAIPGEMIKNGPAIFSQFAAFPIVWILVGYILIPRIMAQHATTGYELLEARLGLTGRLLGASVFVLLRIIWMAAILYATSDKILVPTLKIDPSWTPVLCAGLGLLTLLYTVGGGLKAVVVTDALQCLIMVAGALATIGVVTWKLGGIGGWWPSAWPANWQTIVFLPDPAVRVSVLGAGMNMLVWMTCTAGSDQMAIQRYLATRNAPAARRSFATSLIANVFVNLLLGLVGLAVFGYFLAFPSAMPDGKPLLQDADRLFPDFIVVGLPVGVTGLVIAALLSAAMSSLSSGLNSTAAVVVNDLAIRLGGPMTPKAEVRLARLAGAGAGVIAVALSTVIGELPGNLLDLCFKLVNLLTAPLFVLFFLALFDRRATPVGAVFGVITAVCVAIQVAYVWDLLLWMAPASLAAGIVIGMLVSRLTRPFEELQRDPE